MHDYHGLEALTYHHIRQRLADAEVERLARLAASHRRGLRAGLASALRGLAARLDGEPGRAHERRLATAR
jgi:hypothetical protein